MTNRNARNHDAGSTAGLLRRFAENESGVTAIEYSLIATLAGIAIIAGATIIGLRLDEIYTDISKNF